MSCVVPESRAPSCLPYPSKCWSGFRRACVSGRCVSSDAREWVAPATSRPQPRGPASGFLHEVGPAACGLFSRLPFVFLSITVLQRTRLLAACVSGAGHFGVDIRCLLPCVRLVHRILDSTAGSLVLQPQPGVPGSLIRSVGDAAWGSGTAHGPLPDVTSASLRPDGLVVQQ